MSTNPMTDSDRLVLLSMSEHHAALEYLKSRVGLLTQDGVGAAAVIASLLSAACSASLIAHPRASRTQQLAGLTTALGEAFNTASELQAGASADELFAKVMAK